MRVGSVPRGVGGPALRWGTMLFRTSDIAGDAGPLLFECDGMAFGSCKESVGIKLPPSSLTLPS